MCYADCVPVYFYSESHGYVGLAHAGWRGTYGEIVKEMVKRIDFDLKDLQVVIGPSTSNTYEINDDIKSKFETLTIDTSKYIDTRDKNRHGIDLKKRMHCYSKKLVCLLRIFILPIMLLRRT